MISYVAPFSPPPFPLLYSPIRPMLPLDNDSPGNLSPAKINLSGNSDCHGYPHDASLPDDLFSDREQFVESLLGTHGASLPDDLYLDYSHEQLLSSLIGTHGASLPDDLYLDYSHEQLLTFLIADPNEGNNYEDSNSEFNSFYLEPSNAKSPLTSNMCAKLDGSAQELHQPYGKTEFKFYFEGISPNPLSPTAKLNKAPNDFHKDFAQNQPHENVLRTAETEKDRSLKSCSYNGKQFKAELDQVKFSLLAEISQLKIMVEKLTHQVQDMSDKLSCQKNLSAPCVDESAAQDAQFCKTEDKKQKPYESFAFITNWGATIVDQSVIIAIATDYFPSRIIPTSPAYVLNQPTSGRQSTVASAVNGKLKEVGQQFQLSGRTKSSISAAGQKANCAGSTMAKNMYIFPGLSFLSGAFNKVGRAATNIVSKKKTQRK